MTGKYSHIISSIGDSRVLDCWIINAKVQYGVASGDLQTWIFYEDVTAKKCHALHLATSSTFYSIYMSNSDEMQFSQLLLVGTNLSKKVLTFNKIIDYDGIVGSIYSGTQYAIAGWIKEYSDYNYFSTVNQFHERAGFIQRG